MARSICQVTLGFFAYLCPAYVDAPVEFCGVLMKIQGHRRQVGSHIGIASIVNNTAWVLHAMSGVGVVFCPVKNLYRFRLELVGYYEWER